MNTSNDTTTPEPTTARYAAVDDQGVWGLGTTPDEARRDATGWLPTGRETTGWPLLERPTLHAIGLATREHGGAIVPCSAALAAEVQADGDQGYDLRDHVAVPLNEVA